MKSESMDGADTLLTNSSIKAEEIEIKSEPIDDVPFFEILHDIKKEEDREGDTSFQDDSVDIEESKPHDPDLKSTSAESTSSNRARKECIYEATSESQSADRVDKSDDSDRKAKRLCGGKNQPKPKRERLEVKAYKCDKCEYNTKDRGCFILHLIVHKDHPETPLYRCDECKFITKHRDSLATHSLKHRDPSEVQKYECDECDYKSTHKGRLRAHQVKHKNPWEVQMFACEKCEFKTRHERSLALHRLRHRDLSERQLVTDSKFKTDLKRNFKELFKSWPSK